MNITKILASVLFLSTIVLVARPGEEGSKRKGSGMEHGKGGHGMERRKGFMEMRGIGNLKDLDLTDDQQKKIDKIVATAKKKTSKSQEAVKKNQQDLRAALEKDKPDRKKISALQRKINDERGAVATLWIFARLDVQEVLTDDQRMQLKQRRDATMKRLKERRKGSGDKKRGKSSKKK